MLSDINRELYDGQKLHQLKIRRLKEIEKDLPFEETELGRINQKLKNLSGRRMRERERQRQQEKDEAIALGKAGSALPQNSLLIKALKGKNQGQH